jgi:hypothetical protein
MQAEERVGLKFESSLVFLSPIASHRYEQKTNDLASKILANLTETNTLPAKLKFFVSFKKLGLDALI